MAEAFAWPLLDGTRVLDLTGDVAGAYATKLLADAGADVVKLEPSGGDPLRQWTVSGVDLCGGTGPLFEYLCAGKRSVRADMRDGTGRALAAAADVVVESGALDDQEIAALRRARPGVVVVSLSPFGRSGPWAGRPANEFTLQAAAGSIAGRGTRDRPPVQAGGRVGEWVTGGYAAIGALAALRAAQVSGHGDHVDVSMLEAMVATMANPSPLAGSLGVRATTPIRTVELPSVEPTADGYVGFCTVTGQQFRDFLVMIGRTELLDDPELATFRGRARRRDEFVHIVRAWTTARSTAEVVEEAALFRVPATPIGTPETLTQIDHVVARDVYAPNPGGRFMQPRVPYQIDGAARRTGTPAPALGEHDGSVEWLAPRRCSAGGNGTARRPLEGVRVVDLTAFWAGPAATALLAYLGADVVKLESIQRPDGMRMAGVTDVATEDRWWERSAGFVMSNVNKRGITLDLASPEGRALFDRIVSEADVLVENFTPRVLDNFGIRWDDLHAANPRLILVRMPGFGLSGPWRDRPGFAQTMEQASGMAWLTGFADAAPLIPRGVCDPLTSLHAAFAVLAVIAERDRTGLGRLVECSMLEAALNVTAEMVIEHQAHGVALARDGNRSPCAAPQGLYATRDDERWLALSVQDSAQWAGLCAALGQPAWCRSADLNDGRRRREQHDSIDAHLAAWARERDLDEAVALLVTHGVPAAAVIEAYDLVANPQLQARRFFEWVETDLLGRHAVQTLPFRLASTADAWITRPAPMLGEHNDEVLGGDLGLAADELERLRNAAVIGERPVGA